MDEMISSPRLRRATDASLEPAQWLGFVDDARADAEVRAAIAVERVDATAYAGWHVEFEDLAARAAWPNPFMAPAAIAGHAARAEADDLVVLTARRGDRRLVGVWVLRRSRSLWHLGAEVLEAPLDATFEPTSEPVLDRRQAGATLAALLDFVRDEPGLPRVIVAPAWPRDLDRLLDARTSITVGECWTRALLAPAAPIAADAYLASSLGKGLKRRRKSRQQLAGDGEATYRSLRGQDALAGFERFVALEATGWKGRAGTALAQDGETLARMRARIAALAARDKVAVDLLSVGKRDVAAGVLIEAGDSCLFWKTAYDETLARFAPGVLLDIDITHRLLAQSPPMRMDSGMQEFSDPDGLIWRERRDYARAVIATTDGLAALLVRLGAGLRRRVRLAYRRWKGGAPA
ncbi:MAG: GNAT family N-acetyltransferase [Hyphomicrobiaceae bacterium]|nr:GNAT family N-acetyltransferase [Hyphomicrobiaceae bacterium]